MKEIDRIYVYLKSIEAIYRKYEELKILISRDEEKGHSRQNKRHRNGRIHAKFASTSEALETMRGGRVWFEKVDWESKGDKGFNLVSSEEPWF